MAALDLFSDEASALLKEHIDEFWTSEEMDKITHSVCGWDLRLGRPSSPWGLRAVALGHLRRGCQ